MSVPGGSQEPTQAFAATLVDELAAQGLRLVCIAPGSRSAPLAMAFGRHPEIRVYVHLDERSCAFFALGLAKALQAPVAVLCTSGTAAAELHPAVLEADRSSTPLLLLTADRPPELIDVGANQAVTQTRLFGSAVRWFHDPGTPGDEAGAPAHWRRLAARALAECAGPPAGPVHLNLPFREPLTPEAGRAAQAAGRAGSGGRMHPARRVPDRSTVERLGGMLAAARRPLLVAGEMRDGASLRPAAGGLAAAAGLPLLAEPTSQLRVAGQAGLIAAYDALLRSPGWRDGHRPDLVIRLGAPPTSRPLNQFLAANPGPTVLLDPDGTWRDPDAGAGHLVGGDAAAVLEALAAGATPATSGWADAWRQADRTAQAALDRALALSPLFEAHAVRALARALPDPADLMVGSSMPIRDVDTFWPAARSGQRFIGNRGASGIDGLVSTGLGMAAAGRAPSALLLGDLSLYHDMNGLWAVRRHGLRPTIVVLDNNGGGIFSFLPQAQHPDQFEELFGTPLDVDLAEVAGLYGLSCRCVREPEELDAALRAAFSDDVPSLVLVRFSRPDSVTGHRACWSEVAGALGEATRALRPAP